MTKSIYKLVAIVVVVLFKVLVLASSYFVKVSRFNCLNLFLI